jgi:uncharacterized membrane protein (DUF373 family)
MAQERGDRAAARAGIARGYAFVEDIVYVGLGVLLAGIVLSLLVSSCVAFAKSLLTGSVGASVGVLLDQILLVLLLVELLYTVQVSFREHALVPEPFLLVGLISVIRRILVITAAFGEKHQAGEAPPPGLILELAVLTVLIVALAVSLVLLRKHDLSKSATRS